MKTKNLLMLFALAGMIIFASCKKDDDPSPLTKDEAVATLTDINSSYSTEYDAFQSSAAMEAANTVSDLGLPFSSGPGLAPIHKSTFQKQVKDLYKVKGKVSEGPYWTFPFNENTGTWEYVSGYWTKTSTTPTNQIVVIFSYGTGTNNGKLTYYNYAEKTVTVEGESTTYMSSLSAKIEIDGVKIYSWAYTASLSGSATSASINMKFVYSLGSYTMTQSLGLSAKGSQTSSTITYTMLEELKKDGDVLRSASYTVTLTEATQSSVSIKANYRVKNIIIKFNINVIEGVTDTSGDPAEYMSVSVWTADGAKVADVIWKYEVDTWVTYFEFSNGDTVRVDEYINSTLKEDLDYFISDLPYMGGK